MLALSGVLAHLHQGVRVGHQVGNLLGGIIHHDTGRHLDGEQHPIQSRPDQQQYMRAFCHGPITQRTQPAAPLLGSFGQQYRAHFVDGIESGMRQEDRRHAAALPRAAMRARTHACTSPNTHATGAPRAVLSLNFTGWGNLLSGWRISL